MACTANPPPSRFQNAFKTHLNFHCFLMFFFVDFWSHLDPNLPPKINQNREKSMLRRTLSWSKSYDGFLMHFGTQLAIQNPPTSMIFHWFLKVFVKIDHSKLTSISNTLLVPTCLHFPFQLASQNPPKSIKNRCQEAFHLDLQFFTGFSLIFHRFCNLSNSQNHCFSLGKTTFFHKMTFRS